MKETYRSGRRWIVHETDKATEDLAQAKRDKDYFYIIQSRAGLSTKHRLCNHGATKKAGKQKQQQVKYKKYTTPHILCFWQLNLKLRQEHLSIFLALPQKTLTAGPRSPLR